VVRESVMLAALGLVLGLVGAVALSRLLTSLMFGVSPTDPATLIGVTVLLLAVAALATVVPAWRASRVSPMEAMRG
jgi:putative ABC transport system permease protein